MKRLLFACLFAATAAHADPARVTVLEGDNLPLQIVARSVGEDVAAGDARVAQAKGWLDKVVKVTGEEEKSVAAACERTSRWFFDMTRTRATALEMLEALALLAKPGKTMQDTLADYVQARRQATDKSHAAALKVLNAK